MLARALRLHLAMVVFCFFALAQTDNAPLTNREQMLLERIEKLEQRIVALEAAQKAPAPATVMAQAPPDPPAPPQDQLSATGDRRSLPGFAAGTTLNVLIDGYYDYNFNRPVGMVNLLQSYTPISNSFSLNEAAVVFDRPADPALGRRFGMRLDLMFGQATEILAGNPANEPRTPVYRNIYQAYGTYAFPVGTGLNVDFGRFASPLGFEGFFTKDQVDYSRSYLFAALPYYHMGFRSTYAFSKSAALTWLLVNGANQTEDFNGFKSNGFLLGISPAKRLSWNAAYYFGNENREFAVPAPTNLPSELPATPPGLSIVPIVPRPTGLRHVVDSYAVWSATPKLRLIGEGAYIVNRLNPNSQPTHLIGGAGYLRYQFVPFFSLAGRFEYVSDHGFLTGIAQALKEGTLTATYQSPAGFQLRVEARRDFSNQPFFLSDVPGVRKQQQTTALLGLVWWFGGKVGPW